MVEEIRKVLYTIDAGIQYVTAVDPVPFLFKGFNRVVIDALILTTGAE
jgi:hypothetical protein